MKRILVVDDDDDLRAGVSEVLMGEGYAVDQVAGGQAALAHLVTAEPPSLVLLDMMMPGMSGSDVLAELTRIPSLSHIPVVVFTAHVQRSPPLGARGMVRKPIAPDDLVLVVKKFCGR